MISWCPGAEATFFRTGARNSVKLYPSPTRRSFGWRKTDARRVLLSPSCRIEIRPTGQRCGRRRMGPAGSSQRSCFTPLRMAGMHGRAVGNTCPSASSARPAGTSMPARSYGSSSRAIGDLDRQLSPCNPPPFLIILATTEGHRRDDLSVCVKAKGRRSGRSWVWAL